MQLRQYWHDHPHLRRLLDAGNVFGEPLGDPRNLVTRLGKNFARGPHAFVPLVREQEETYCSLDILFLRRDIPGKIVSSGGDLDNRLKTLLDALKVPDTTAGLPVEPEPDFDPIFCLLQDDAQITRIHVTTDRLLLAPEQGEKENNVLLVLHVHVYRGTNVAQVTGLPGNA